MQVRPDNFDVNFNLGQIEFDKGEFEKAIHFLQKARIAEPDNPPVLRTLGHAYFKMKKYKEALTCIKAAIQSAPNDKESLFTLAQCYWESDQMEQALKIYNQLRSDPAVGGAACLASGTINMQHRQIQKAIEDFEMGLQCKNLKPDNMIEMKYRLAVCLIQSNNIGKALTYLNEINAVRPNFKDTPALITRYQEMNANRNLQIYLMGPVQEFQELCKQVVHIYYRHAKVKITEITMERNDWADILADIDTPQWSDSVMFRFIRLQGAIGEMVVRDFHGHIKEVKAGKGICITVGNYTDEAKHFTEARLIDLVEKHKFLQVLNKIDTTKIGATKK
jgi:tetratricopeptide (TPR) repeat protein